VLLNNSRTRQILLSVIFSAINPISERYQVLDNDLIIFSELSWEHGQDFARDPLIT